MPVIPLPKKGSAKETPPKGPPNKKGPKDKFSTKEQAAKTAAVPDAVEKPDDTAVVPVHPDESAAQPESANDEGTGQEADGRSGSQTASSKRARRGKGEEKVA